MPNLISNLRTFLVRAVILLAIPIFCGIWLDSVEDQLGTESGAIFGIFGGILLDIVVALYLVMEALQNRYTLIGSDGAKVGFNYISGVLQAIAKLPSPETAEGRFSGNVLRNAGMNEIEMLAKQFGDGEVHVSESLLPKFYASLKLSLKPHHEIWATCFTRMEDFWAKKDIGADYLDLNLELAEKGVSITRIFGMPEGESPASDGMKTELIRRLSTFDPKNPHKNRHRNANCEIHAMSHKPNAELQDLFLIVENDTPLMALEWRLDHPSGNRLRNVVAIYDPKRLATLHDLFKKYLAKAPHVDYLAHFTPPERPLSIRTTVAAWRLHTESATSNQIAYLTGLYRRSREDISNYWDALDGSLIRPHKEGLEHLHKRLQALSASSTKRLRVLSLGCTPETRAAIAYHLGDQADVMCFDLFQHMHQGMNACAMEWDETRLKLPASIPQAELAKMRANVLQQRWEPWNWLLLEQLRDTYDLIVGVDAINMISHSATNTFVEALTEVLAPQGNIFMQAVTLPEARLSRRLNRIFQPDTRPSTAEAYRIAMDLMEEENLSPGEAFSQMALSRLLVQDNNAVLHVGKLLAEVREIERTLQLFGAKSADFGARFEFCNSELAVKSRDEYTDKLKQHFTVETDCPASDDHTSALCWYWLSR